MWPYLCGGTASLKFRQFKSAVCDAFGVFCLGGVFVWAVTLLADCRGVGVPDLLIWGFN